MRSACSVGSTRRESEVQIEYLERAAEARFGEWDPFTTSIKEFGDRYGRRLDLVDKYSWSIPDPRAIEMVAAFGKVMDPMAGTGYWMGLVEQAGATVRANDLRPMFGNPYHKPGHRFVPIACGPGERFVQQYPDYALFLSWPPYEGTVYDEESPRGVGYRIIKAYTEAGGQHLIFVGEGEWGCTGCSSWGCSPGGAVNDDGI